MSIFTESYKKAKSKLYETIDLPCEDGGVLVVSRRNADEALSIMQEENHDLRTQLAKANERVKELELSMGKLRTEILHACVEGSSSSGGIKKSAAHHLHHQALMIPPYAEQLRKEQE